MCARARCGPAGALQFAGPLYSSKAEGLCRVDLQDGAIAMSPATSPIRLSFILFIATVAVAVAGSAVAQPLPDTENGRYSLQPSGDGVIRLDTRTGAVSNCSNSPSGWACYMAPDERKAMDEEIGRLQAENARMKSQLALAAPGKTDETLPKSDKQGAPKAAQGERQGERKIEIPLLSDQDVDRVISFLERAWQRLVDMANRMQKDAAGKI
jgi:hypothetical protein